MFKKIFSRENYLMSKGYLYGTLKAFNQYQLPKIKTWFFNLLNYAIKSLMTIGIFFYCLSMFVYNIQVQTYHFDNGKHQIITQYHDIVQCNDNVFSLLHQYYFEK